MENIIFKSFSLIILLNIFFSFYPQIFNLIILGGIYTIFFNENIKTINIFGLYFILIHALSVLYLLIMILYSGLFEYSNYEYYKSIIIDFSTYSSILFIYWLNYLFIPSKEIKLETIKIKTRKKIQQEIFEFRFYLIVCIMLFFLSLIIFFIDKDLTIFFILFPIIFLIFYFYKSLNQFKIKLKNG